MKGCPGNPSFPGSVSMGGGNPGLEKVLWHMLHTPTTRRWAATSAGTVQPQGSSSCCGKLSSTYTHA